MEISTNEAKIQFSLNGTLGSYLDWKIDYEPTDEMEQNI